VNSYPEVSYSASAVKMAGASMACGQGGQPQETVPSFLINRPPNGARNLAAGSRLPQLSPVSHVHIGRRSSLHLAGPEQECL
jgi:hypothetical protein